MTNQQQNNVIVHVGVVTFFEEPDATIYMGWSREEVEDEVYDFVAEDWGIYFDPNDGDQALPEDKSEAIDIFFERVCDSMKLEMYTRRLLWPPPPDIEVISTPQPVTGFSEPAIIIQPSSGDALDRLG